MPRTPQIRYFASRKAYYTQYQGVQHLLATGPKDEPDGPTYQEATRRFAEVIRPPGQPQDGDEVLVLDVITRYLQSLEVAGKKQTLAMANSVLGSAIQAFGTVKANDLRPYMVNDWLARMAQEPAVKGHRIGRRKAWSITTQASAAEVLLSAFSQAVKQGVIVKSPIATMTRPERRARGPEVVPPEELQDVLIAHASQSLAKILRIFRGTGARPGEIIHAECKHYRPGISAIVHTWNVLPGEWHWKCAKQTKRDRVIYLDDDLKGLVESEILERGGRGRILLTARGVPWTVSNLHNRLAGLAVLPAVAACCKKHGFDPDKLMAYGFRHAFITRMMSVGAPIKFVADLCGTSVKQIERTYSHAHDDHQAMRKLFLQFQSQGQK